mgnify:CR=1
KICGSTLRLLNKKGLMAIRFRKLLGDRSYFGGSLLLKFVCVLVLRPKPLGAHRFFRKPVNNSTVPRSSV